MTLHQRFFEAPKLDLEAAKILTEKNHCQPALYHLQQAYEKCIKSYFIFKEIKINNTPEDTVYNKITKLSHNMETSTITLLKDMADIEKHRYDDKLPDISDPRQKHAIETFIAAIDNYELELDRLTPSQALRTHYIDNVQNYRNYVTGIYYRHQTMFNRVISKQPDTIFLNIVFCMMNLYLLFYNMELVARYPLKEFSYENINLLSNENDSCQKIIEISDDLIHLESNDLK